MASVIAIFTPVAAHTGEPDRAIAALQNCSRYRMNELYLWTTATHYCYTKRAAFNNVLDIPIFQLVRVTVAPSGEFLPQPKETFAAFPSGDRCLGHPKVKLFALERSPNVPHATNIAQFT